MSIYVYTLSLPSFIEWNLVNWLSMCFRLVGQGLWVRMNLQQVGQPKSSNGYGCWKSEKEGATKSDNKIPSGKSNASSRLASTDELQIWLIYYFLFSFTALLIFIITGVVTGNKGGSYGSPSHDRLVYLKTCLIGQHVEVQVKNGSIYSGIFHATNSDKDFGMFCYACVIDLMILRAIIFFVL